MEEGLEEDYFARLDSFSGHNKNMKNAIKACLSLGDVVLFKDQFAGKIADHIRGSASDKKIAMVDMGSIKRYIYRLWRENKRYREKFEERGEEVPEAFPEIEAVDLEHFDEAWAKVCSDADPEWREFDRGWESSDIIKKPKDICE